MGQEWLNQIVTILAQAGIASGEEYASAPAPAISQPVGAVGLRGLDWETGRATVSVRILSPRSRGGWACQLTAARAVEALEQAAVSARMGQMEYRSGIDCFEVVVLGEMQVRTPEGTEPVEPVPPADRGWTLRIGDREAVFATEFSEEQDRDRRILGAMGQEAAVGVTPGRSGWRIRLVQQIPADAAEPGPEEEPAALQLDRKGCTVYYTDCYWDRTRREFGSGRTTVEQWGFALGRREERRAETQV